MCRFAGLGDETNAIWDSLTAIKRAHLRAGQTIRKLLEQELIARGGEQLLADGYQHLEVFGLGGLSAYRVIHKHPEHHLVDADLLDEPFLAEERGMARMIPSAIDRAHSPPGEITLFNSFLERTPAGWTVLHSIDIPRHVRQVEGELDFLVLIPGVAAVCLEVKSHQSVRRDSSGMWRLGQDVPTPRSPFKQAAEAMHSTRRRFEGHPGLTTVPFVSAVGFTRCRFGITSSEWEPWQVFDESDLQSIGLTDAIERVGKHYRAKLSAVTTARWFDDSAREPTVQQCDQIIQSAATFQPLRSPKARFVEIEGEIRQYTEEQFEALDELDANRRIVFTGAAGMEHIYRARGRPTRAASTGQTVLLCCYNRLLGSWMRR